MVALHDNADRTEHINVNVLDTTAPGNARTAGVVAKDTWKGRIWDTWDLPGDERRLLFKVDAVLLTLCSMGYFLKNIDQENINNAFLSGMKEELGMHGNELVTAVTIWTVGYVVGQIPVNLLLTRIRPAYVIGALELGWGLATLGSYSVKSYKELYACRFLVGLFESGFYPAAHMILGSWYTPRELGKRATIFWISGQIGKMFSGFLQAAAYTNLNGHAGLAGWRWLFIVDAIITLPIAILSFFFLPDLPLKGNAPWWLTKEQFQLATDRVSNSGKKGAEQWSKAKFKRIFGSWHAFVLPILYVIWNNGIVQSPMGYWLKSFNTAPYPVPDVRYSVAQINNRIAILIVTALMGAWISDGPLRGRRWPPIYFGAVVMLIGAVILKVLPLYQSISGHYAIYWLINMGTIAGPLILSWINEICAADLEKRALLVAAGNDLAYVVQAIAPNFVWKTTAFPAAQTGLTYSIILQVLLILWTTLIILLLRRDKIKEERQAGSLTPALSVEDGAANASTDGTNSKDDRKEYF